MGRFLMSFCFTAIALFSSLAFGLFEEQAGEYDWKIESIGAIQQSFNKVKSLLLRTYVKLSLLYKLLADHSSSLTLEIFFKFTGWQDICSHC
jgi:hypothetical protein